MTRSERLLQAITLMPASETHAIDLLYAQLERAMQEEDCAASGTLTEGGDAKQAPGDSLSGPAPAGGDAR